MTEVKVNDHERKKPNGGTTHVKSYWRHQEGSISSSPGETNLEDEEQKEKEDDDYHVTATVEGTMDDKGNLKDQRVTKVEIDQDEK